MELYLVRHGDVDPNLADSDAGPPSKRVRTPPNSTTTSRISFP